MNYNYYQVVKAVVRRLQLVEVQRAMLSLGRMLETSGEKKSKLNKRSHVYNAAYNTEGGFEDTICGYVDVWELVKSIKNVRKRRIIAYKAMGYMDWEIAKKMKLSERMIRYETKSLKNHFLKSE